MESRLNVLFVCDGNRFRSPTAQALYEDDPRLNVKSSGLLPEAPVRVTRGLLEWADVIFVMEKRQRNKIRSKYEDIYLHKRIVCLYIRDEYDFMDPTLVGLLRDRVERNLASIGLKPKGSAGTETSD
jgi:predicted protein tyrosine phosphatase